METELSDNLRRLLGAFILATNLSEATVARHAAGDWRFFERIACGASFRVRTYDRVIDWFSAHWPAGSVWPEDIARPSIGSDVVPVLSLERGDE